jgi:ABC-2 type transport system ATP-binding protein
MTATSSGPPVQVTGLTKRYGDKWAVQGVDLTVEWGSCTAVLGPNGAGKTTTMEILEGFRSRSGGSVSVLGTDPERAGDEWRSQVGIVLQDASDQTLLTVREVVHHFARYYPDARDPDQTIDSVGLTAKGASRVGTLSGGQRRRLDVALGIIGRPRLLFLDEPTTGFDPQARRQFWGLIESLRCDGTTILLTTHYLDEAEHLADTLAVMAEGQVVAFGSPAELRWGPSTVSWLTADGLRHREKTSTPTRLVTELAASFGGEVPELSVQSPSLEDAYLRLISAGECLEGVAK